MADRVYNGEDTRERRANETDFVDSGQARVSSGINVTASAVPSRPAIVPTSGDDVIVSEINSLLRGAVSRQNGNHAPPGMHTDTTMQLKCIFIGISCITKFY